MNNQEKKAVLGRYREAQAEAERLEREILRWKTGAERTMEAASWMQEGCASRRALEETAAAMQGIALALADRRRESCRLRADLETRIDAVGDPRPAGAAPPPVHRRLHMGNDLRGHGDVLPVGMQTARRGTERRAN